MSDTCERYSAQDKDNSESRRRYEKSGELIQELKKETTIVSPACATILIQDLQRVIHEHEKRHDRDEKTIADLRAKIAAKDAALMIAQGALLTASSTMPGDYYLIIGRLERNRAIDAIVLALA